MQSTTMRPSYSGSILGHTTKQPDVHCEVKRLILFLGSLFCSTLLPEALAASVHALHAQLGVDALLLQSVVDCVPCRCRRAAVTCMLLLAS
jgi:hypothetical protein